MAANKAESVEEKRRRILAAARSVFMQDGNLDGGMRRIAALAGCTTGAVYKLFSCKEEIFTALLEHSLVEFNRSVSMAAARQTSPEARLRAATFALVQYYQSHEFEYRLGLYMYQEDVTRSLGSEPDGHLNQLFDDGMAVFESCFRELRQGKADNGEARDLAHSLLASMVGVLGLYFSERHKTLKTEWQKILDTALTVHVTEATR